MSTRAVRRPSLLITATIASLIALTAQAATNDWTQFGGPNRDFSTATATLAESWAESGPKVLWEQPLGDHGHATVLAEGDRLYAFFRSGETDVLRALDAANGATIWEKSYESPLTEGFNIQFGPGPHSTPTIAGEHIFTVSSTMVLKAWNKASGDLIWSQDLKESLSAQVPGRGYGSSPLAYGDTLILAVGGEGQAIVALSQVDGSVVWKSLDGGAGYASPVLAEIAGREQVIVAVDLYRAGLDPSTGEELWRIDVRKTAMYQMSTPTVFGNRIVASQAYEDGTRVFEVTRNGDAFVATELLYSRKLKVMHGTTARVGNLLYGSSGDFGPAFLTALDLETGQAAFRMRGFAKANVMAVGDDRLLILDEDGQLAIATPQEEGVEVLASAQVLDGVSWAAPTLVGTKLYLANRTQLVALDLSANANRAPGSGDQPSGVMTTDAGDSGTSDALTTVPARSATGRTLAIPDEQADRGSPHYLMRGMETQFALSMRTSMQRLVATTGQAVGYLVRPHDLEDEATTPLIGAAVRIPVRTLETGSKQSDQRLHSPMFFNQAEFPEIGIVLHEIDTWTKVPTDNEDTAEYEATLEGHLEVRGNTVAFSEPAKLAFYNFTAEGLTKTFADLALVSWQVSVPLADLGISVPPPMLPLFGDTLELDAFLSFDNTHPERSLDHRVSPEEHLKQGRFEMLLNDFGDTTGAYEYARAYAAEIQDRPTALTNLAAAIVATDTYRDLTFAKELAERAVAASNGDLDPMTLQALARTHYLLGDREQAIESQKKAIEVSDGKVPPPVKMMLQAELKEYEG